MTLTSPITYVPLIPISALTASTGQPLSPDVEQAYAKHLTDTGAHLLAGWMLQAARFDPRIAAELERFHSFSLKPTCPQIQKEAFRDPIAA